MDFVLFAISIILCAVLWSRISSLEQSFEAFRAEQDLLPTLTRRVFALERMAAPPMPARAETPPPPQVEAVVPEVTSAPRFEPVRATLRQHEWETLIGGSVLNAVGAVVLVIGIALFLAYSFAHMSAGGRASVALVTSLGILAAGVWAERKARYQIFARGLIGAGWAALYATAYAIYAIPAAQIVSNPIAGSVILLAVAIGMIAHSLRYRSQAVTAVAYFAAFAALAVTPSSPFAVASLIPIAASILYLAERFEWNSMPLFGLIATYATCISRGESDASLFSSQALFLAYWLLFETFDLRRAKRCLVAGGMEFLFPLNALGFLALSYVAWDHHRPYDLWLASACASALFLASSLARVLLRPRTQDDLLERLREGGYEASLAVSALLAALAIAGRAPGMWAAAGLALEAEILYLAAVRSDSGFLRGLSVCGFGYSLLNLLVNADAAPHTSILGFTLQGWTPAALLHIGLFYWNCAIRPRSSYFGYAATALAAIVVFAETPHARLGLAWAAMALLFQVIGWRFEIAAASVQSRILAVLACGAALLADTDPPRLWISIPCAAIFYAADFLAQRPNQKQPPAFFSILGTVLSVGILYGRMSGGLLTISWGLLGLALLGCGFAIRARAFRLQGLALLLLCILKLFLYDLRNLDTMYRILSFVGLGCILLAVSWIYSRYREDIERLI